MKAPLCRQKDIVLHLHDLFAGGLGVETRLNCIILIILRGTSDIQMRLLTANR